MTVLSPIVLVMFSRQDTAAVTDKATKLDCNYREEYCCCFFALFLSRPRSIWQMHEEESSRREIPKFAPATVEAFNLLWVDKSRSPTMKKSCRRPREGKKYTNDNNKSRGV